MPKQPVPLPEITVHASIGVAGQTLNLSAVRRATRIKGASLPQGDGERTALALARHLLGELEEPLAMEIDKELRRVVKALEGGR